MANWAESKVVQFAVGVTLVVLLIRWLVTGDLLFAASVAMQGPPAEGETQGVSFVSALWPLFFDAMVIIGAAALAAVFKLWDWLYGLVAKKPLPESAATKEDPTVARINAMKVARQELFDAARSGNAAKLEATAAVILREYPLPPPPPKPLTTADIDTLVDMLAARVSANATSAETGTAK